MPRKKVCKNPSCGEAFSGNQCPNCKAVFGSSKFVPPKDPKPKKVDVSVGSTPTTVYVADGIFSVQYWQTNRCFVRVNSYLCGTGEDTDFCTRADCAEKRIIAIRTSSAFSCPHTDKVKKELDCKHVIER